MDSDNNAPCFSLAGLVWLSAARHQASRHLLERRTHAVSVKFLKAGNSSIPQCVSSVVICLICAIFFHLVKANGLYIFWKTLVPSNHETLRATRMCRVSSKHKHPKDSVCNDQNDEFHLSFGVVDVILPGPLHHLRSSCESPPPCEGFFRLLLSLMWWGN